MDQKKRTKKPRRDVSINVDLPNADVNIERDINGDIRATLDTNKIDIQVEKTDEKLTINVEVDDHSIYEFESNGKSKHMAKGQIFKVAGKLARYFIERGFGRIKK
jgi:carbon monoxide dehydrogenase subunit G